MKLKLGYLFVEKWT